MTNTLQAQAAAGDVAAQIALARQYEGGAKNELARGWFSRAAKAGDVAALRMLAINLLVRTPSNVPEGIGMIRAAAERGDAEAAHLCAVLAAQDTQLTGKWDIAFDYLRGAAERGHAPAREQLRLLSDGAPIDMARWLTPARARPLSEAPRIAVAEGFASAAECDWLIARARPELHAAKVYDPQGGGGFLAEDIRSNSTASFNIAEQDVVMTLLRERAAQWTGLSTDHFEPLSVLHYAVGQQFAQHYDFIDPENPQLAPDLRLHGQRWATLLVYLSDDFAGGETDFPELGLRYRGAKGDALLFWNVTSDGMPDIKTLHAGLAPTRGEKWLLSQWMRRR